MILVDCRSVFAYPTALLSYQRCLANHLPAVAPAQEFAFLRSEGSLGRLVSAPNATEWFVPGNAESPLAPWMLARHLRGRPFRLFHATGGSVPAGLGVPVVSTVHDLVWLTHPEWARPQGIRGRLAAWVTSNNTRRMLRDSDVLIAPSQAVERAIQQTCPRVGSKVRVVAHGVGQAFRPLDRDDFAAVSLAERTVRRLLPGVGRFVLDVGRAAQYRNHLGLVRAFAQAFRSDPEMHLAFVQPISPHSRVIMRQARVLGLQGRVHVLSGISTDHLIALYQSAACVCHPSLHESYGSVVAEAMSCGCPVITSGRAAVGEIADGVAQLINPEHDDEIASAMLRVVRDASVSNRMSERGLERALTLRAATMVELTWGVYKQLLP